MSASPTGPGCILVAQLLTRAVDPASPARRAQARNAPVRPLRIRGPRCVLEGTSWGPHPRPKGTARPSPFRERCFGLRTDLSRRSRDMPMAIPRNHACSFWPEFGNSSFESTDSLRRFERHEDLPNAGQGVSGGRVRVRPPERRECSLVPWVRRTCPSCGVSRTTLGSAVTGSPRKRSAPAGGHVCLALGTRRVDPQDVRTAKGCRVGWTQ
jgi:hypothetical protein